MSIADLREAMNDTGGKLTMRYEDGGKVQVFMLGDVEIRLGLTDSLADVKAMLADEMAKRRNPPDATPANG